jgi:FAD synthase
MHNKIVLLDEFRKQKDLKNKDIEEAKEFLDTIFPTRPLTVEDEKILKELGIPMVEFTGTTLQEN